MELFHESKNRYFSLVLKVINLCSEGLSEEEIKCIIDEGEYEDKPIGKDLKTFEGFILNKYEEEENFNLIKMRENKYFPFTGEKKKCPVPIRFTSIEKQWLKELLKEATFRKLLGEEISVKLEKSLINVESNCLSDIIVKTNKVNNKIVEFEENYYHNFSVILQAIKEEKEVVYNNVDKFSRKYNGVRGLPLKIEYSTKDEILRVSLYYIEENRPIMVNLHTMSGIEIKEDRVCGQTKEQIYASIKEKKYCLEPIVLELRDERSAMERCFMSFSSYERYTRIIGENRYEIKLYYYTFEETEIIRRILSLGPYVKVIGPNRIREKIVEKIKKALEL